MTFSDLKIPNQLEKPLDISLWRVRNHIENRVVFFLNNIVCTCVRSSDESYSA